MSTRHWGIHCLWMKREKVAVRKESTSKTVQMTGQKFRLHSKSNGEAPRDFQQKVTLSNLIFSKITALSRMNSDKETEVREIAWRKNCGNCTDMR